MLPFQKKSQLSVQNSSLSSVFRFDAVVHFAAMKAVGESMEFPLLYYKNNAIGTINLLDSMSRHGCKTVQTVSGSQMLNASA